jgi:transcriptional regulator with XRE-family HTH domain
MTLKTWLKINGFNQKTVADDLKISRSYFCQIVAGKRVPTKDIALKIEDYTNNKVSRMELLYPRDIKNEQSIENEIILVGSPLSEDLRQKVLSSVK